MGIVAADLLGLLVVPVGYASLLGWSFGVVPGVLATVGALVVGAGVFLGLYRLARTVGAGPDEAGGRGRAESSAVARGVLGLLILAVLATPTWVAIGLGAVLGNWDLGPHDPGPARDVATTLLVTSAVTLPVAVGLGACAIASRIGRGWTIAATVALWIALAQAGAGFLIHIL